MGIGSKLTVIDIQGFPKLQFASITVLTEGII
jgi:hypothetical protein